MWVCSYCGKENRDDENNCLGCGCAVSQFYSARTIRPERRCRFLCWKPTAIILWTLLIFSIFIAAVNVILIAKVLCNSTSGELSTTAQTMVRFLFRGIVENMVIALFCFMGWFWMRQKSHPAVLIGSIFIIAALIVTLRRWILSELTEENPLSWIEPLFIWPLLIYAIMYGLLNKKKLST